VRWQAGRSRATISAVGCSVLDRSAFSLQDLAVGDVVADLATARLSQSYLVQRLRDTAVSTERLRLARDLHDGVLQTLTGAALQLQTARRLLALDPASSEERLSQVQRIIAAGQNDLRFFIHQLGPRRAPEVSAAIDLRGRLHEAGRSSAPAMGRAGHGGDGARNPRESRTSW
jgi:signal transduction histidine kinase